MSDICTPIDCTPCEIPQLARNTFFDGKPMSARDFADEQDYFLGKHRRHSVLVPVEPGGSASAAR